MQLRVLKVEGFDLLKCIEEGLLLTCTCPGKGWFKLSMRQRPPAISFAFR
jgi:hypothetical protein